MLRKKGLHLFKTTMKIEGIACSMCEAHINDLIRKHCNINKIKSSASKGETVVVSDEGLDITLLEKEIANIGYKLVAADSVPYEKKRFFGKRTRSF